MNKIRDKQRACKLRFSTYLNCLILPPLKAQQMNDVGLLLAFVALLFTGFFLLNLYFRIKVVRSFHNLSRNGVEFATGAIFSIAKMNEVVEEYPDHKVDLLRFSKYLRYSVLMASVFIVVTIVFGSILMYFR